MNYGARSHLPEHCSKEFLDSMRLTALTAEELPAILFAGGFAAELALENPNLPLSALQNVKAITEPDLEVVGGLVELARSPFAPEWLLELALQCNNRRVVQAALGNPKTALESRLRRFEVYFAPDADKGVLFPHDKLDPALALMRGLTFDQARELAGNTDNEHLLIAYLSRPELTYEEALELANSVERERVKAYTVLNDRIDAPAGTFDVVGKELYDALAKPYVDDLLAAISAADNGDSLAEERLAKIARNPYTPVEVLEDLIEARSDAIRSDLAKNPNTPAAVLRELAADASIPVAVSVAKNPSAPLDALTRLLIPRPNRHARAITSFAARHPKLTWRVRTENSPRGARHALYPLSATDRTPIQSDGEEELVFFSDLPEHTRTLFGILQNPNASPQALEAAYQGTKSDLKALAELARSKHTLPSVHERLLKHGRQAIRAAAVSSPHTTPAQLREAAADRTAAVRFSVAEHHMTPDDILYALRNDPDPKVSREAATMARTWSYRGRVPLIRSEFGTAPYRL